MEIALVATELALANGNGIGGNREGIGQWHWHWHLEVLVPRLMMAAAWEAEACDECNDGTLSCGLWLPWHRREGMASSSSANGGM